MSKMKLLCVIAVMAIFSCLILVGPAVAQFGGGKFVYTQIRYRPPAANPTLVAKGENFLLHSFDKAPIASLTTVPYAKRDRKGQTETFMKTELGVSLSHTALGSGTMKWLFHSGTFAHNTVRMSYSHRRVLGVAFDNERLYLCVWGTRRVSAEEDGVLPKFERGEIHLLAFWEEDGSLLTEAQLQPTEDVSQLLVKDNLISGPLNVSKNSVTCFGETLVFERKNLIRHSKPANKNADKTRPPGRGGRGDFSLLPEREYLP